ncbi:MAG: galactokinase family protein [Armatimonadota bacterium]
MYNHECRIDECVRDLRDRALAHLGRGCDRRPEVIARAPGRLEVLGGHTDYNEGFVLAVATRQATVVAAARREDSLVRAWTDRDGSEAAFDIRRVDEGPRGRWWDTWPASPARRGWQTRADGVDAGVGRGAGARRPHSHCGAGDRTLERGHAQSLRLGIVS